MRTEAQWEELERRTDLERRRFRQAERHWLNAQKILSAQLDVIRKGRENPNDPKASVWWETCEQNSRKYEEEFFKGWGFMLNPEIPGVEAIDLGRRDFHSRSIHHGPFGVRNIGIMDGPGRLAQSSISHNLRKFGDTHTAAFLDLKSKERLKPEQILGAFDQDQLRQFFKSMLDDAASAPFSQRERVARIILELFRFTEPKVLVDKSLDLENMSETDLRAYLKTLSEELP